MLVDLAEDRRSIEQLVVGALRHDPAVLQHDDVSASAIVESRWAITNVVRPRIASVRPPRIGLRRASTEAVASSRMRIRGSISSARAIASRWRWPPESVIPRSPMTVS